MYRISPFSDTRQLIHLLLFVALVFPAASFESTSGQEDFKKWEKDIARFEATQKKKPAAKGGVLFLGSSSIRMWKLDKSFPGKAYVNRGFGGSQISDSIHYFDRLVGAIEPGVIVFYAGDNDIAKGKSPERVAADFKKFAALVKKMDTNCKIVFVAIKPSISRWNLVEKMRAANKLIAKDADANSRIEFADIDQPMIGTDDKPIKDLFAKDGLHLNEKGYEVWTKVVKKYLKSN